MKFTKHSLKKLETLLADIDYEIIYGKGNFHSGYAIVEEQRKIVVNRYFETEARINSLLDIIDQIQVPEDSLDEKQLEYLNEVYQFLEQRANSQ
ncbi:MAG: hypothetical protein HKN16_06560 [Saprospiraceae bacterium]|nr:hypothetical protein [Saprospiraceae bacterium]